MKKVLYSLLFSIVLFASFTSCTEEEVKPQGDNNGGGEIIRGKD